MTRAEFNRRIAEAEVALEEYQFVAASRVEAVRDARRRFYEAGGTEAQWAELKLPVHAEQVTAAEGEDDQSAAGVERIGRLACEAEGAAAQGERAVWRLWRRWWPNHPWPPGWGAGVDNREARKWPPAGWDYSEAEEDAVAGD